MTFFFFLPGRSLFYAVRHSLPVFFPVSRSLHAGPLFFFRGHENPLCVRERKSEISFAAERADRPFFLFFWPVIAYFLHDLNAAQF